MTGSLAAWGLTAAISACLLLAVVADVAGRIIPNRLVLVVAGCGVGLRLIGAGPFWPSLVAALIALAVIGTLAARDLVGWGDAKMIAAVTFAVPVDRVIVLLLAIALAGGLLSGGYLAARTLLRRAPWPPASAHPSDDRAGWLTRLLCREAARIHANEPMPYAVAIAGGLAYGLATA